MSIDTLNVTEILSKLEKKNAVYEEMQCTVDDLMEQQVEYIEQLLKEYKPIIEFYSDKNIVYKHPSLGVTARGSIVLGISKDNTISVIYNMKKNLLQLSYRNNHKEPTNYSFNRLVRDNHFTTAVEGIRYLDRLLDDRVNEYEQLEQKLRSEIESVC